MFFECCKNGFFTAHISRLHTWKALGKVESWWFTWRYRLVFLQLVLGVFQWKMHHDAWERTATSLFAITVDISFPQNRLDEDVIRALNGMSSKCCDQMGFHKWLQIWPIVGVSLVRTSWAISTISTKGEQLLHVPMVTGIKSTQNKNLNPQDLDPHAPCKWNQPINVVLPGFPATGNAALAKAYCVCTKGPWQVRLVSPGKKTTLQVDFLLRLLYCW